MDGEHIRLFVATRAAEVPKGCKRYASVDGRVPGATHVWDHHSTGEAINLDVLPDRVNLEELDGIASTHVDTDAILSAVTLLLGGRAALDPDTRVLFEAACHFCDHLRPHPQLAPDVNLRGERLHAALMHAVRALGGRSRRFDTEVRALVHAIRRGDPLPQRDPREDDDPALVARLEREGRVRREGKVALVDLSGLPPIPPLSVYGAHGAPVGITHNHHRDGGFVYTVGINPHRQHVPRSLRPVLAEIAAHEYAYGPPATSPAPGENNWGGRAEVFGSPWTYGSRIPPEELLHIVSRALEHAS